MTTPTYAQYKQLSSALAGLSAETIEERLLTLFSVVASGQNPDGTPAPGQSASSALLAASNVFTSGPQRIKATQPSWTFLADNGGFQMAIDSSATVPFRDFAIGRVEDGTGGSVSDVFYISHNASTTTLSGAILAGATTLPLNAVLTMGTTNTVLIDSIAGGQEVVTVSAGSGTNSLTCSATAHAHGSGARVTVMADTTHPVSFGFGVAQPAPGFRMIVEAGATTQGGLRIQQFLGQTAKMLSLVDSGSTVEHVWIDPSSANNWLTVLTGDSSTASPIFRVVDLVTQTTVTAELQANGRLKLSNPAAAVSSLSCANTAQTNTFQTTATGELNIGNNTMGNAIIIGNHSTSWSALGFFGHVAVIQPSGTPAASTDLASVVSLANALRTALLNLGLVA